MNIRMLFQVAILSTIILFFLPKTSSYCFDSCNTKPIKKKNLMPKVGDTAPDFSVKDSQGNAITLSSLRGQKVVLYFYPKDDTPGCTKEACSFRDSNSIYREKKIRILGVSLDDEKSHQAFATKYSLSFTLLADVNHEISSAYGVYEEQEWQGKKFPGVSRKTFLINESGIITKIFDTVKVESHSKEVLDAFETISK